MSNSASLSKEDCTCQLCNKILLNPILVPCKCKSNICQEHLNSLFANNVTETFFECKKCKTKLNLLKTGQADHGLFMTRLVTKASRPKEPNLHLEFKPVKQP